MFVHILGNSIVLLLLKSIISWLNTFNKSCFKPPKNIIIIKILDTEYKRKINLNLIKPKCVIPHFRYIQEGIKFMAMWYQTYIWN